MINPELIKLAKLALQKKKAAEQKQAFTPMDASGVMPEGDPSMQGGMPPGMPPGGPPMDPGMDPSMQGGGMPPPQDPIAGQPVMLDQDTLMQLIQQVASSMGGGAAAPAPAAPAAAEAAGAKKSGKKEDQGKLDTIILQLTQLSTLLQSVLGIPITSPVGASAPSSSEGEGEEEAAPAQPPAQPIAPPMSGGMQVQASDRMALRTPTKSAPAIQQPLGQQHRAPSGVPMSDPAARAAGQQFINQGLQSKMLIAPNSLKYQSRQPAPTPAVKSARAQRLNQLIARLRR